MDPPEAQPPGDEHRRGRTQWWFRAAALVVVPLLSLACVEVALRLSGFGYPTAFLRRLTSESKPIFAQNNQFGWRFFGRSMARRPYPIALPVEKMPQTVRIFVFGESAAYGDPQPRFGLARMLEVMLAARYPTARFEIANAAMTGINSHAILTIARDCARANGDIWVVYMGNNEVVGPFGAGTVFGSPTPPLPLIRARLGALRTRTGQWFDSLAARLHPLPALETEWGGMKMFLDRPVTADDPSLQKVYQHFGVNLRETLRAADQSDARVVLCTVAVNLRDCGPFGSMHRKDLSAPDKARWESLYRTGLQQQAGGQAVAAVASFEQAAALDDRFAELRFRQGECALKLSRAAEAARHFEAARDLDTLRFRCDSHLNQQIREIAATHPSEKVRLADTAKAFAEGSPERLPGRELFCDHVHFTFDGTYLLARTIAAQVEPLLPAGLRSGARSDAAWPSLDECARRLAWTDWNHLAFLQDVWKRQADPPFKGQANHRELEERLRAELHKLQTRRGPEAVQRARDATEAAIARRPVDPELQAQLAELCLESGDAAGAEAAAHAAVRESPTSNEAWAELGRVLVTGKEYGHAAESFSKAIDLDCDDVWSMQNLAQALLKLGRADAAEREYRRALKAKPRFGLAWLGLGQLLEEKGDKPGAELAFRNALANPIRRPAELLTLARFCKSRQWTEAAVTNYTAAIRLNPMDSKPYFELGQTLSALNRTIDAANCYAELVQVAPEMAEARFLYGVACGRLGRSGDAAAQFREAVRLKPDLLEARLNLGIALMKGGQSTAALEAFEAVLQRDPGNAIARRHRDALR